MQVLTVDFQAPNASTKFASSLINTGFGIISNHSINMQLVNAVYREWQAFFDSEYKHNYVFDTKTQDGYFPYLSENAKDSTVKDLKEFYHVYPWGKFPKELGDNTMKLFVALSEFASTLLAWLEKETPKNISQNFSMPLSEMGQDSPRTLFRILHYPPLTGKEQEGSVRAAPHEDINLITILPAATTSGLQVKDNNGNWYDVKTDPDTIVINAADMLQLASNGYYKSTTHRVLNPTGEAAKQSRLSMPLFVHPRDEVLLAPNKTANDYRLERLREIGLI